MKKNPAYARGDESYAASLRRLIGRTGLTQKAFAEKCDMPYNTIRAHVTAARDPTLYSLRKIRAGLGCTWDELLDGRDDA